MKSWISLFRCQPPPNQTILSRTGNSYFFAGYSPWRDKWFLLANGKEEVVEAPQFWLADDEYIQANQRDQNEQPAQRFENPLRLRRSKRPQQTLLNL